MIGWFGTLGENPFFPVIGWFGTIGVNPNKFSKVLSLSLSLSIIFSPTSSNIQDLGVFPMAEWRKGLAEPSLFLHHS